ncbi:hypothetical protein [Pyrobaculum sp.]|uniref:hypothetical protein n=1 Tax=Pyrobaculum sp. TaxID=2004705 RepID=UPI003D12E63F
MRWLYLTYVVYWSAFLIALLLTAAGHPPIRPEAVAQAVNETSSLPYEQRFAQAAADFAIVAALSYPALLYAATVYGAATAAAAAALGAAQALLHAAVYHVALLFMEEAARWHPLAQKLGKRRRVEWGRYILWVAASISLAGVLSL